MFLLSIFRDLWKVIGIVFVFFLISGAYLLIKPTEEDKYLDQQWKMYPLGFHCTDENDEEIVAHFDMKSQLSFSTGKEIYKYSMKNALYKDDEKKPFGCEMAISYKGSEKIVFFYIADEKISDFDSIRYEPSDDKDLIYQVVNKAVKKKQYERIHVNF